MRGFGVYRYSANKKIIYKYIRCDFIVYFFDNNIKTPATMAITAIILLRYGMGMDINFCKPVTISQMPSNTNPSLLFIYVTSLYT